MSGTGQGRPEPVQVVKQRRDAALAGLVARVPYIRFLGVSFERRGDELTAVMPFEDKLIGNPMLPALHGGATAGFLEVTAIIGLGWALLWDEIEGVERGGAQAPVRLPKTIDFTVDYLRSGLPRDAYARAHVTRAGRRYSSVRVAAWQDNRDRPFAEATGHFLMPARAAGKDG
ncbi:thioesterase [Primorskyibacter flagellatus]|uniref:Thioesterase n=1 Tax=Primorskyibacter flagellatus TaxID=1387277 RepID=A0A917A0E9_9RHOB|nr:PaaI family thioesterase [Primorskyibacter flagellatus]GGE19925.1 thioesterase [Primorskyibacter flagellatus]